MLKGIVTARYEKVVDFVASILLTDDFFAVCGDNKETGNVGKLQEQVCRFSENFIV